MIVKMFQPRFAPLVEALIKRQTIRPIPKRFPKTGDDLSLRAWSGKAYRSKQRVLLDTVLQDCWSIKITQDSYKIHDYQNAEIITPKELNAFARADGFRDWSDLRDWFETEHGLTFSGVIYTW